MTLSLVQNRLIYVVKFDYHNKKFMTVKKSQIIASSLIAVHTCANYHYQISGYWCKLNPNTESVYICSDNYNKHFTMAVKYFVPIHSIVHWVVY